MSTWHPLESGLDNLLSHIHGGPLGVLDLVRGVLHDVLHPFAQVGDWALGTLDDLVTAAWNYAGALYQSAVSYAGQLYNAAIGFARGVLTSAIDFAAAAAANVSSWASSLFNQAVHFAQSVYDGAVSFAQAVLHSAVSFAQALGNDIVHWAQVGLNAVVSFAQTVLHDAVSFAQAAVGNVVSWVQEGLAAAGRFAQQLVADAVQALMHAVQLAQDIATAALGVLYRDVIAPIERDVAAIGNELFGWATPLLHVLEAAVSWVVWVTERGVPDVLGAWHFVMNADPLDIPETVSGFIGSTRDDALGLAAVFLT